MAKAKKQAAEYDPKQAYQWSPTEDFPITGRELEYMFKTVTDYLSKPPAQEVLRMMEVHKMLEGTIRQGVLNGKIKPKPLAPAVIR